MSAKNKRRPQGFQKHLEGWEVGAVSVAIAGLAALLGVPRPVMPDQVPLPRVHRERFGQERARWDAAADAALSSPLDYEVRAAGEAFRAVGRASAAPDADVSTAVARFRRQANVALRAKGPEPLLALRSVQLRLFFAALRRWHATGRVDSELIELAGRFADQAAQRGWLDDQQRLRVGADELAALFVVRWTSLAAWIDEPIFAPTLDTWRLYYRLQILYGAPAAEFRELAELVKAIERRDPSYPSALAKGILELRQGRNATAADALRAHLQAYPYGPWTLRARNYLAATSGGSRARNPGRE